VADRLFGRTQNTRRYVPLLLALLLAGLGYVGNGINLPIFFGVSFSFGTIAVIITSVTLGWRYGVPVAVIANCNAMLVFDPYIGIASIFEAVRLGWNWRNEGRNLIADDLWYWLLIGIPFLGVVHHYLLHFSWNDSALIALQHGIEHLLCTTIASFLLFHSPLENLIWRLVQKPFILRSVRQTAFNFLVAIVFIPVLVITSIDSHLASMELEKTERNQLSVIVNNVVEIITRWENWEQRNFDQLKASLERQRFGAPLYLKLVSEDERIVIDRGANFPGWYQLKQNTQREKIEIHDPEDELDLLEPPIVPSHQNASLSLIEHYFPKQPQSSELENWRRSFYRITRTPTIYMPWHIEIALSIAPQIDRLEALYIRNFIMILGVMMIAIVLADILGNYFALPLRQLGIQTTDLPNKLTNEETLIWPKFNLVEIEQLSSNFKQVSRVLQTKFQEAYHANEELEVRVRKRTAELELEIEERKRITRAIQKSQQRLALLVEQSPLALIEWDINGNVVAWNPAAETIFGYSAAEAIAKPLASLIIPQSPQIEVSDLLNLREAEQAGKHSCLENITRDGRYLLCDWHNAPLIDPEGQTLGIASLIQDVTAKYEADRQLAQRTQDLELTLIQLKQAQVQLVHSEKMSSLGQLVAGIAHEINNPVGFIHSNLNFANEHAETLLAAIAYYQETYPEGHNAPEIENLDLPFIQSDFPALLQSMQMGTERIRDIVQSLRNFSRLDESDLKLADISEGLDNTLLVVKHRLNATPQRSSIQIKRDYDHLPAISCYPSQLNQVFLNLITNAIDALEETSPPHIITIRGWLVNSQGVLPQESTIPLKKGDWMYLSFSDTGSGIPKDIQGKIFDPFFTTKPVGSGTGMGLSICHQIIVDKHHGTLLVSSDQMGTTFTIGLPY
jgi:PAS domain S-box-containing protein